MLFFLVINILNIEMQVHDYKKDIKLTHQYILNDKIDKEYLNSVVSIYDDFNMQIVKNTKMDLYDYNPSGKYKLFIDNCYKKLEKRVEEIKNDGELLVINSRHKALVHKAIMSLEKAEETLTMGMPVDVVAIYIKEILEKLGKITGETVTDDIISEIFSKFCLGK